MADASTVGNVASDTAGGAVAGGEAAGPWGALIGGGLGLANGIMGAMSSDSAASAAAAKEEQAIEYQKQIQNQSTSNLQPTIQAGNEALQQYQKQLGSVQQPGFNYQQQPFNYDQNSDPGTQFQIAQAAKAIGNSALAKGMVGGGTADALAQREQEIGGTAYQGAYNRYMGQSEMGYNQAQGQYTRNSDWLNNLMNRYGGLAQSGAQAGTALATTGSVNAGNIGKLYQGLGATQAGGIMGSSSALRELVDLWVVKPMEQHQITHLQCCHIITKDLSKHQLK